MAKARVDGMSMLVVEDEPLLRKQVCSYLERLGAEAASAEKVSAARELVARNSFDLVLLDVNLPDGSGLDLLKDKTIPESTGVIVMTAHGGVAGAVEAMRLGAADYLVKPFDLAELPLVLERALQARQSARLEEQQRESANSGEQAFFFGASLAALQVQLNKILAADARMETDLPPVLIEGETGTGKTTIARWLHRNGPRAKQPLVEVNCSALPESLAESELFGHERGAFTDAKSARIGLFEAANGGTLFMDELPSLSPALQTKVLTAIEDHRIRRLGASKTVAVDVRIIAATNRDLKSLMVNGQFREDLYHRLDLYRVCIPPLRRRGADILELAEIFIERLCRRHRLPRRTITPLGKQRLVAHPWPGNVRELAHELERAIVFEESAALNFEHLATGTAPSTGVEEIDWLNPAFTFPETGFDLEEAIHRLIERALNQANNNVSAAARILGVSRDYVRYRLEQRSSGEKSGD